MIKKPDIFIDTSIGFGADGLDVLWIIFDPLDGYRFKISNGAIGSAEKIHYSTTLSRMDLLCLRRMCDTLLKTTCYGELK